MGQSIPCFNAVPSLVIFMGIYFATGNILLGVVIGFGLHVVGLAYSEILKGLFTNSELNIL